MATHKKYPKIHRLGKPETEGILDGPVTVEEKIDGANVSIWMEDGQICLGSRNHVVEDFRGLRAYVEKHEGLKSLIMQRHQFRLYGEWLIRHTIKYDDAHMGHFYLFDIYDHEDKVWALPDEIDSIASQLNIKRPQVLIQNKKCTEAEIREHVGKSALGDRGEGVVIKRPDFVNKFGDQPAYAKIVCESFAEDNKATFGGNSKQSTTYWETYTVEKYMTLPRVIKTMMKLESALGRPLELKDTPRVAQTAYHDMLTEEIWEIQKKVNKLNFKELNHQAIKKATAQFKLQLEAEAEDAIRAPQTDSEKTF